MLVHKLRISALEEQSLNNIIAISDNFFNVQLWYNATREFILHYTENSTENLSQINLNIWQGMLHMKIPHILMYKSRNLFILQGDEKHLWLTRAWSNKWRIFRPINYSFVSSHLLSHPSFILTPLCFSYMTLLPLHQFSVAPANPHHVLPLSSPDGLASASKPIHLPYP